MELVFLRLVQGIVCLDLELELQGPLLEDMVLLLVLQERVKQLYMTD